MRIRATEKRVFVSSRLVAVRLRVFASSEMATTPAREFCAGRRRHLKPSCSALPSAPPLQAAADTRVLPANLPSEKRRRLLPCAQNALMPTSASRSNSHPRFFSCSVIRRSNDWNSSLASFPSLLLNPHVLQQQAEDRLGGRPGVATFSAEVGCDTVLVILHAPLPSPVRRPQLAQLPRKCQPSLARAAVLAPPAAAVIGVPPNRLRPARRTLSRRAIADAPRGAASETRHTIDFTTRPAARLAQRRRCLKKGNTPVMTRQVQTRDFRARGGRGDVVPTMRHSKPIPRQIRPPTARRHQN